MGIQQFSLKWNEHQSSMLEAFQQLLSMEVFVDVTLACEGFSLKAHKIVLSAFSSYFRTLLVENPCQHPVVILKDVRYVDLKAIVDFMYQGEVRVSEDRLPYVIETAKALNVKGLVDPEHATSTLSKSRKASRVCGMLLRKENRTDLDTLARNDEPDLKKVKAELPDEDAKLFQPVKTTSFPSVSQPSKPNTDSRSGEPPATPVDAGPSLMSGQNKLTESTPHLLPDHRPVSELLPQPRIFQVHPRFKLSATIPPDPMQLYRVHHQRQGNQFHPLFQSTVEISSPVMSSSTANPSRSTAFPNMLPPVSATVPCATSSSCKLPNRLVGVAFSQEAGGRRYIRCQVCHESFLDQSHLKQHVQLHENIRNTYSCDLCTEVFISKYALKKHKRNDHASVFV